jgi:hypothetical protein
MKYDREWLNAVKNTRRYADRLASKIEDIPDVQDRFIVRKTFRVVNDRFHELLESGDANLSDVAVEFGCLNMLTERLIEEKECAEYSSPVPET